MPFDYIRMNDEQMAQAKKVTSEHVSLESLAGTKSMIPSPDFYQMVFENLLRSPTYFVGSVFGVG